jgi:hypothetical protein
MYEAKQASVWNITCSLSNYTNYFGAQIMLRLRPNRLWTLFSFSYITSLFQISSDKSSTYHKPALIFISIRVCCLFNDALSS